MKDTAAAEHFKAYHEEVGEKIDLFQERLSSARRDIRERNYGKADAQLLAMGYSLGRLAETWDRIERLSERPAAALVVSPETGKGDHDEGRRKR